MKIVIKYAIVRMKRLKKRVSFKSCSGQLEDMTGRKCLIAQTSDNIHARTKAKTEISVCAAFPCEHCVFFLYVGIGDAHSVCVPRTRLLPLLPRPSCTRVSTFSRPFFAA